MILNISWKKMKKLCAFVLIAVLVWTAVVDLSEARAMAEPDAAKQKRGVSLPGKRSVSLPGKRSVSLPGKRSVSLPGKRSVNLPGKRSAEPEPQLYPPYWGKKK
ncbi:hypothetical protein TNIN_1111 [Trichonephila inaurata madagascariensis]|uniref:Uncharacterized protein n=1 Tax=Trichonephila inaurata madagascariensis TaxID=2747483 RepID=A0A8X6YHG2_9ARAC|nr:hypothetical protein TNIN_1111 [Trichonephila inaurata madagascariensis]